MEESTEEADEVAFDAEVFILLCIFERDSDIAADIIVLEVGRQFDLLLAVPNLVESLGLLGVQFNIDFDTTSQSSKKRGELILNWRERTIRYY